MVGNQQALEVLTPQAEIDARKVRPARRVPQLDGKKIGFVSNRKPGAEWALDRVGSHLAERYPGLKYAKFAFTERPFSKAAIEQIAGSGCDALVASTGD